MLKKLHIKNYILIESVSIDFEQGFTALTGETGAGKSILLGALSLLLGERADFSNFFEADRKCTIEGVFDLDGFELSSFFEKNDLDNDAEAIIRREIHPNGKSRAFINDTPVNLNLLKELGSQLIDVHSQFSSSQINSQKFRLNIIDTVSESLNDLNEYRLDYYNFKKKEKQLIEVERSYHELMRDQEFLNFQHKELETLELKFGEEKELESEYELMANSEDLLNINTSIINSFEGEESSSRSNLSSINKLLVEASKMNESLKEAANRFASAFIEIEDVIKEIENVSEGFEYDQERFNYLEDRLAEIHRLKLKHGAIDSNELIAKREDYSSKIDSVNHFEEDKQKLENELNDLKSVLVKRADGLSKRRAQSLSNINQNVENVLKSIGIPDAVFSILQEKVDLTENGADNFVFLFSANKGKDPQEVSKSASGGELSRIMLALKMLLANKIDLPTLIFDEIDTGVSGEVADQMGKILHGLGQNRQVISITHLPQVAAKGAQHMKIFKEENENGKTTSGLKKLEDNERLEEIAKMLSGEKLTDASINNAKELLSH